MNMEVGYIVLSIIPLICHLQSIQGYIPKEHPCCGKKSNHTLNLAMVLDAYEIYGHDPLDKLDNLWLYQNEMMKIINAQNVELIDASVKLAAEHLGRFANLHLKELKILLIALDDTVDNMLTMYDNHNNIAAERKSSFKGGSVAMEFYMSREYYCGKNVYIFVSELYSDIYNMAKGQSPYCLERTFVFLDFLHFQDDDKYHSIQDPSVTFPLTNYMHGLECNLGICIYRFPFKAILQRERDVVTLPKAIVKCGHVLYKLPPLTAASCIISSGSFILDFNIQGLRYRHRDFLLTIPNGISYYTKEPMSPLACEHNVCEWNYTNVFGGAFFPPGEDGGYCPPPAPYIDATTTTSTTTPSPPTPDFNTTSPSSSSKPSSPTTEQTTTTPLPTTPSPTTDHTDNTRIHVDTSTISIVEPLKDCMLLFPPNYGSIAGKSYIDPIDMHDNRFRCVMKKSLYWYPQWSGQPQRHPYLGVMVDDYSWSQRGGGDTNYLDNNIFAKSPYTV